MKPTITAPLLSIPLLLLTASGSWAEQSPLPTPVSEPATTAAPAAAPATNTPAEATANAAPASAAEPAAPEPAAAPTSLSADQIARRPPSEWNALIDQRERDLERMRQSQYPRWPSAFGPEMNARSQQIENQIQDRMQQLQRRLDAQRYRYQSPWDRASSDWWDYQRSLSRLQSLRTQEYLDQMMQRGMAPNHGYPSYPGARGW